MVNQFNPQDQVAAIKARREERNRKTQALLSQYGGRRGAGIARDLANQQQNVLNAPAEPAIPQQQQQQFDQGRAATSQAKLPFGVEATVGAKTGDKENSGNPEFGSWFGSGVLENIAGKGIGVAENLQKGIETFGGMATAVVDQLTPGQLYASQNDGRGFLEILKETQEESGRGGSLLDAAGQAQNLAEAFRVTDMPSVKLDLVMGEGINLPGDRTLNEFQFGIKGLTELLPDALLTVATGGTSLLATGSRFGLAKGLGTVAARTVGLDVLAAGAKSIPRVITKSSTIKELAKPVYKNVTNLTFQTGWDAIQRAKVPEMRNMLNRVNSVSSAAGGALGGVMHAVNPAMLLENGKNKMVDLVYGRLNALSLVPGAVEANIAVFAERLRGIGNAPAMIGNSDGFDIGRRVASSAVGRGIGKVRNAVRSPVDESPLFVYDQEGRIVSETIAELNGRVWTDAVSSAFEVSTEGELVIRQGKGGVDAVVKGSQDYVPVTRSGKIIDRSTYDVPEPFDRYVLPKRRADGTFELLENEGTAFYTASRHMIETYQDMAKHYTWSTGKMVKNTVALRFTDAAYVPQVPNGGDWFDEVKDALGAVQKPGDKRRPFQERTFFGDDLQAAIDEGHYTMAGPMEAMQSFMTNMYTTTIDAGMSKSIKVLTNDATSGVIDYGRIAKNTKSAMTRLSKGGVVTEKLLKKLDDVGFDSLPQEIRRINKLEGEDRAEALTRLDAAFKNDNRNLNGQYHSIDESKGKKAPAFSGILFRDADEAKAVSKAADLADGSKASGAVEVAAEAGDLLRLGKTGFDFGFHMIHGIPALGIATGRFLAGHPKESAKLFAAWGNSTKNTVDAFFRPQVLMKTLMKDPAMVMEAVENGLQMSKAAQDFFLASQNATLLRKIPKAGEKMDSVLTDLASSFERAFVAPGDLLRIEGYRILRNTAGQTENGLAELSGFLNKMTGALNSSASGVSRGQQQAERAFLFFSPRYTRSAMALLSDVYRGGTKGELARQTMAGMAFFGAGTYYALTKAMGQEPKFDPTTSDFMTVKIGDSTVGVGGFWTQFVRLTSKLTETAWDTDAQEAFGDASENPLWRWVRSRAAPGAGLAWDIANGEDYMGRQFTSLGDTSKHVGRQLMPIWLEAMLLEDPYRTGPAGLTAEVLGARTNPLSASKRRRQLRDSVAVDAFGKKWDKLNTQQRKLITKEGVSVGMSASEIVQLETLTEEIMKGNADRGESVDVNIEKWHSAREDIDAYYSKQIKDGIDHLQTEGSGVDPQLFRQFYLNNANGARRTRLEDLNNPEGEYAETMSYYTDVAEKFGNEHPEDVAYAEYIDNIIATEDFDDPNGYDFRRRDDAVLSFRQRWGDEVYAYVQETFAVGKDLHPIVEEFYKGRAKFEYYWRSVEEASLAKIPRAGEVKETYQQYLDADKNGKRLIKDNDPLLRKYLKLMTSVKKELRKKDKLLDAWLFRWGYTDTLSHKENRVAPDGISNPREFWRQPDDFPLYVFGLSSEGVNLPAMEQQGLQLDEQF